MGRTIIVSNRIPVKAHKTDGKIEIQPSQGGLATGLSAIHPKDDNLWVGWHGMAEEEIPSTTQKDEFLEKIIRRGCIPVSLTQKDIEEYYYGYSNKTIWPVFHYFTEFAKFSEKEWKAYKKVNRKFAEEILQYVKPDDTVWIHDYHLMLLPALLRKKMPELRIGFFLHIPFPVFEVFRILPNRKKILKGILGADLVGFHTSDYQQYFLNSVRHLLNPEINCDAVNFKNHICKTGVFPMGIDYDKFHNTALKQVESSRADDSFQKELHRYMKTHLGRKFVLSIDRLDYTKGIARRIRVFDYFLKQHPEYIEKVQLIMLAVPSRTQVEQYQLLKKEVDELVGRINSRYARPGWSPILYLFRSLEFEDLVKLYASSDVALLTPVRDGMNLVAKEYIASRPNKTGVLILSEMAGASTQLSEALLINPNDFNQISETLKQAFDMPVKEQQERMAKMQERLQLNTVFKWAENFLENLNYENLPTRNPKMMTSAITETIVAQYQQAERRLFFIDYDGTLTGFQKKPERAVPSRTVLKLLKNLSKNEKNEVYIISGRNKEFLESHFGSLGINLIAEHGAYRKNGFLDWKTFPGLDKSWMEKVEKLLQEFVANTPGSHIEKKNYSLAWHYRSASEWGDKRAKTLYDILKRWSGDLNIAVLNGNKVIEITSPQINKGIAVKKLATCGKYGFLLAVGDDHTDEYMFSAMPSFAVTLKVGAGESAARFRIQNQEGVVRFLSHFREIKFPPAVEVKPGLIRSLFEK